MAAALEAVPAGIPAEGVISAGPVGLVVQSLAEQLPADLVVIGSHGWSTPDHASVTERVIAQAPCPALVLHEGGEGPLFLGSAPDRPRSPRAVVPTDFSPTASHALRYAYALARALPLHLDVLHVLPGGPRRSADAENTAREQLEATVPSDLTTRVITSVCSGDPATEILAYLAAVRPQFVVIGEHARDIMRRLFTRDTARAVAHASSCPVWIVPARAAV
jgi:universal stress protein A